MKSPRLKGFCYQNILEEGIQGQSYKNENTAKLNTKVLKVPKNQQLQILKDRSIHKKT